MKTSSTRRNLPSEQDHLGFAPVVQAVAKKIWACPSQPLNVGIFGEWGSGKSSFLQQLKKELERVRAELPLANSKLLLVDFAAWRFQHGADPAVALVNAMMASQPRGFGKKLQSTWRSFRAQLNKTNFDFTFKTPFVPVAEAKVGLDGNAATAAKEQKKADKEEQHGGILEPRYFLHDAVKRTFSKHQTLTVVFVDDLDRCIEDAAVEILEAIKTVFEVEWCTFVIAANPHAIRKAVARRVGSEQAAEEYLEKFLDVTVTVPFVVKDRQTLAQFLQALDLPWRRSDSPATDCTAEKKRLLDDLFLRGVRPNPRDMVQAAEKFDLLKNVVEADQSGRLAQVVDDPLLLKIALLQNLLGERYDRLAGNPALLRDWELGISRPEVADEEGRRILGEILKTTGTVTFSSASFADLHEHDLHVYSFLAANDSERAIQAVKSSFWDLSDRIAGIAQELEGVTHDANVSASDVARFNQILLPLRRAMTMRFEVPPDIQATFAALMELAQSDCNQRQRVAKFFDSYLCQNPLEFFPLLRWEIVASHTVSGCKNPLIKLIRPRAKELHKRKSSATARDQLLRNTCSISVAGGLAQVGKVPVTNLQYEMLDPGHVAMRHSHNQGSQQLSRSSWESMSVSMVNLIDAALYCEWLNCSNNGKPLWAVLPALSEWQKSMEKFASESHPPVTKVEDDVWEWTRTFLDGTEDTLKSKSMPCTWVCGGSWYENAWNRRQAKQNGALAAAVAKKQWFNPMHQRLDLGFRIFWYSHDPFADIC